jgi:hypothetical protein
MMTGKDGSCSVFRVAMVLNYSVGDLTICDPFRAQLPADCLSRYRNYARYYIDENMQINSSSRILTLSTCSYEFSDARLVVVARLRRDGESVAVDTSRAYPNDNIKYPQKWYDVNDKTNNFESDPRW